MERYLNLSVARPVSVRATHIVRPTSGTIKTISQIATGETIPVICTTIAHEASRPDPIDVLYGTAGLLQHDRSASSILISIAISRIAQEFRCVQCISVPARECAIGNGKIQSRDSAREEDIQARDTVPKVVRIRWKLETTIAGHVD